MIQPPLHSNLYDNAFIILDRYIIRERTPYGYVCYCQASDSDSLLRPIATCQDAQDVAELEKNSKRLLELLHPNIARLLSIENDPKTNTYFNIVKHVAGDKLHHWAASKRKNGTLPIASILPLLRKIAEALDVANKKECPHPALRPSCIFVTPQDEPVIKDFDLLILPPAALAQYLSSSPIRSWPVRYMPPEICDGGTFSSASNQYTLAVIAYELLAGHPPFDNSSSTALQQAIIHDSVAPIPGLSEAQNNAFLKALAKKPEERFASCTDFINALKDGAAQRLPALTSPTRNFFKSRHNILLCTILAAFSLLVFKFSIDHIKHKTNQPQAMEANNIDIPNLPPEIGKIPPAPMPPLVTEPVDNGKNLMQQQPPETKILASAATADEKAQMQQITQETKKAVEEAKKVVAEIKRLEEERNAVAKRLEAERKAAEKETKQLAAVREAAMTETKQLAEIRKAAMTETKQLEEARKAAKTETKQLEEARTAAKTETKQLEEARKAAKTETKQLEEARAAAKTETKRLEETRKAAEAEASRIEAARKAEEERKAAEEAKRVEAARKAAEEAKRVEAARKAAEEAKRIEAAQKAAEKAADEAKRVEAAQKAAEEAKRIEAARKAAEEAKRIEAARKAAEEAKRIVAERKAEEERKAAEEAKQKDKNRIRFYAPKYLFANDLLHIQEIFDNASLEIAENLEEKISQAAAQEQWRQVKKIAGQMKAYDSAKASRWQNIAEKQLAPSVYVTAWLDGKEVNATFQNDDGKSTPTYLTGLVGGATYSETLLYNRKGEQFTGKINFKVDWKGMRDLRVILKTVMPSLELQLPDAPPLQLVKIEAGDFTMGGKGSDSDETLHAVKLTRDFWMGKYEVTQSQWKAVMGGNPSNFKSDGNPVEGLTWNEAMQFCEKLNAMAANALPKGYKVSLPTEAQWEFAARGGNLTKNYLYSGSDNIDIVAWHAKNSNIRTQPVGQKFPNELGLYDMTGNVWEWCLDACEWEDKVITDTYRDGVVDPVSTKGGLRIIRGGGWLSSPEKCRIANRLCCETDFTIYNLGLRIVLVPKK